MATIKHPVLPPTMTKAAYTVIETIELLAVSRTTLYKCISKGDLRITKCGRKTLILTTDIEAFLLKLQNREAA